MSSRIKVNIFILFLSFFFYLKSEPKIVSLTLPSSQILIELGAKDLIFGIDKYSWEFIPELKGKEIISTGSNFSLEKLIYIKPDLVIIWWYQSSFIENLKKFNINCLIYHPKEIKDVFCLIEKIGNFIGYEKKASQLIKSLNFRLSKIKNIPLQKRPLIYLELSPFKTVGQNTFTNQLIELAGGRNLGSLFSVDYPILSSEEIISLNPDIIILVKGETKKEEVLKRAGWKKIKAIKNGKVYEIPKEIITPGSRFIEGVELINNIVIKSLEEKRRGNAFL